MDIRKIRQPVYYFANIPIIIYTAYSSRLQPQCNVRKRRKLTTFNYRITSTGQLQNKEAVKWPACRRKFPSDRGAESVNRSQAKFIS